ncbi:MAG TPA: hypothetical protein VN914_21635 [Polyangia bacterium]|nr:hypothetical protein [Polyangia bacterium]
MQVGALWRHGRIIELGTLNPFGTGSANAVNSKGHAVGSATAGGEDADLHAVIWR